MLSIPYPKHLSEFDIQAFLWYQLRRRHVDARLEVSVTTTGRKVCRLDVVVFGSDHKAVCIIECKTWTASYVSRMKFSKTRNSKQVRKYEGMFGIPVLICGSGEFVRSTAGRAIDILKAYEAKIYAQSFNLPYTV